MTGQLRSPALQQQLLHVLGAHGPCVGAGVQVLACLHVHACKVRQRSHKESCAVCTVHASGTGAEWGKTCESRQSPEGVPVSRDWAHANELVCLPLPS